MLFEDYKKNPNSGRNSVNEIIFKKVRCAIGHLVGNDFYLIFFLN